MSALNIVALSNVAPYISVDIYSPFAEMYSPRLMRKALTLTAYVGSLISGINLVEKTDLLHTSKRRVFRWTFIVLLQKCTLPD
jgi:hypothetical protein